MEALTRGTRRQELIAAVEEEFAGRERELVNLLAQPTPDSFFEVVNDILNRRGLEFFCAEQSDSRSLAERRQRREDLLRCRRELRRQLSFATEEEEE
eukprot:593258-Pyramimonas_sp.AAC.1